MLSMSKHGAGFFNGLLNQAPQRAGDAQPRAGSRRLYVPADGE